MLKTKDVNSKNKKKTIVNITDIERQKCYICIEMYKKNERSPPFSKGRLQKRKKIPEKGHHFELCNSACVCVYCFVCVCVGSRFRWACFRFDPSVRVYFFPIVIVFSRSLNRWSSSACTVQNWGPLSLCSARGV